MFLFQFPPSVYKNNPTLSTMETSERERIKNLPSKDSPFIEGPFLWFVVIYYVLSIIIRVNNIVTTETSVTETTFASLYLESNFESIYIVSTFSRWDHQRQQERKRLV